MPDEYIGRGSAGVKVSLTIEPMLVFFALVIRHRLSAYIFPLNDIRSQVLAISHRWLRASEFCPAANWYPLARPQLPIPVTSHDGEDYKVNTWREHSML